MPQSSTVENYLKAIYQAEIPQNNRGELVSMGQLSSALGVVPGTATTMVKALAETGLVRYEPYAGVQLTEAGQRLAALVLRRHRVLELFLVKVLDMSWAEVHEEAERLEHAASDRLIDRIDAMLGRPSVDPHGDPIPDSDGSIVTPRYQSLLTCPLNTSLVLSRVSNQDTDFLRFLESNELTPGQSIRVENRDNAADHVLVRRVGSQEAVAIGMRA
ncbi:MAG TPA: metal-dependent transcriptional regulator, partial [Planctomycetes bacterium]|nr:metal-dependent transcriptional regulator [Planctomycetota bacterium]